MNTHFSFGVFNRHYGMPAYDMGADRKGDKGWIKR